MPDFGDGTKPLSPGGYLWTETSMSEQPSLDSPRLAPVGGGRPKQLVLLLHGVGADGNDLIGLAPYFQRVLPEALFVSPNAPERYDMAPFGHQWFSLRDFSMEARESGVLTAAPILNRFIDEALAAAGLAEKNLVLIGFSQGTMMALHVGLRRERPLAGIIGYSGMLIGPEQLTAEIRSRPPVLLTHGESDQVLPVQALGQAAKVLEDLGVPARAVRRPGLGHGIDEDCVKLGMLFLAEVFGIPLGDIATENQLA